MVNAREDGIKVPEQPKRTLEEDLEYIERVSPYQFTIRPGFVPGMRVPGSFYVDDTLWALLRDELRVYCESGGERGAFLPAVKQIANVASLPGIVGTSVALPDVHSGYGFSIGNVAAFDVGDPEAIVSPGGVGFDINCGVRLLRTSLMEHQVAGLREELAQALFDHIPVGVGSQGLIPATMADLNAALELGMDWSLREGYAWPEDKERCEEQGRMLGADPSRVSERAKRRGLPQLGTLGAGNHYAEIQVVEEIFNPEAARAMGIDRLGQVCVMIHSGSRGLGHEVAKDAVDSMLARLRRTGATINDRQLACAPVASPEGQDYLAAMACAANYAWVNRSAMTFLARQAFSKIFKKSPVELDMHVVYDVSHNIAKLERHSLGGRTRTLLVHRKGATRAFPPHSPLVPAEYQLVGQPVLVGGTMGTCSYVLTGTHKAMEATFGSTCHGAGRSLSRNAARNRLDYAQVLQALKARGIAIRVASPKLVMEEAPESYKDVCHVVDTCHHAGITLKAVKLRPIAVIKG